MSRTLSPRHRVPQAELVARARSAYLRRAEVRRRLRHSNTDLHTLLTVTIHANASLGSLQIRSALNDLPGMGEMRVNQLLNSLGMDGSRRLRSLSPSEALALANRLDAR